MNGARTFAIALAAVLAAAAVFAAVTWVRGGRAGGRPEAPIYGTVSDFRLADRSGREVTLSDLRGRVWVAGFIFTRCAGTCPQMTEQMERLQRAIPARDDFRLVSFSVDPTHDTTQELAVYAARYGADPVRWLFLTGPDGAVAAVARGSFKLAVGQAPPGAEPSVEPIFHSTRLALVDREGQVRGYYDALGDPETLAALEADARSLLGPERR